MRWDKISDEFMKVSFLEASSSRQAYYYITLHMGTLQSHFEEIYDDADQPTRSSMNEQLRLRPASRQTPPAAESRR